MNPTIPDMPKWTKEKSFLPMVLSFIGTFSTGPIYEILKDPNLYYKKHNLFNLPTIDEWLGFYEVKDIEFVWLKNWFAEELKNPAFYELGFQTIKYFQRRTDALRETPTIFAPFVDEENVLKFAEWLDEVNFDDYDIDFDKSQHIKYKNKFDENPITVFLMRVWLPCFYHFGETPFSLLKKTLSGHFESFCNLLRIDKSILNNDEIAEIFQKISLDNESKKFNKLLLSINAKMKMTSKSKMKGIVAAMISESAQSYGQPLTSPQIQEIFDFVAQIKDQANLVDPDIESTESFAKQIQRKAPLYRKLFQLDKK